ncbi:hypothetical protein FHG87_020866 [Trinorchestia longiramus]|nr:hypothetical protein FHG87_020866 [Trinorchestia longiramus]
MGQKLVNKFGIVVTLKCTPVTPSISRRSRGTPRACLGSEEEGKSCCGMLVTQAVSIRWFIIMIAFVGLCCTVVGTVLGAIKTHNSEYVTITLLMIGVGIVLITVSGVAWHLTSRDAPCRVMLGLSPAGVQGPMHAGESRRFMRMAPSFGRPHHPYAAMMYPEFQFRPPPPSYQASMQEYRLRLLLLDRATATHHPPYPHPPLGVASPPPIYRSAQHRTTTNTLGRESIYSHPPSYRSREGSISQNPDAGSTNTNPNPTVPPVHSRDPSCLSFLSHDSLYSTNSHDSRNRNRNTDGSITGSGALVANKDLVEVRSEEVLSPGDASKKEGEVLIASTSNNVCINSTSLNNQTNNIINNNNNNNNTLSNNNTLNRLGHNSQTNNNNRNAGRRDGNTVTIVQTTGSSQVIGNQSVIVTVSGDEAETSNGQNQRAGVRVSPRHQQAFNRPPQQHRPGNSRADAEISVLAHL